MSPSAHFGVPENPLDDEDERHAAEYPQAEAVLRCEHDLRRSRAGNDRSALCSCAVKESSREQLTDDMIVMSSTLGHALAMNERNELACSSNLKLLSERVRSSVDFETR